MKISVIVAVGGNDINRYINMLKLLDALNRQTIQPYELIIVEQCLKRDDYYYYLIPMVIKNTRYFTCKFCEYQDLFCVGWLRNIGIYKATGDIIVCLDVDYVFDSGYLEAIVNADIKKFCVGWSKIYYVNPNEKRDFIQTGIFPTGDENYKVIATERNGAGGSQIFNRNWFIDNIVGYSEDIFGWGKDDCDVYGRCYEITKEWHILNYTIYHLHHDYKQKDLYNNDRVKEKNYDDPVLAAQLMKKMGVGDQSRPNPIYPNSIEEAEIESFGNRQ